jgi:hypothetical protein
MTIRDGNKYLESLWDWGFLEDCFDENIRVTDIDGFVERKGKFLVIETKLPSIEKIPTGQMRMFREMLKTGLFTILIVYGNPGEPERGTLWKSTTSKIEFEEMDLEDFHSIVENWFRWADYK